MDGLLFALHESTATRKPLRFFSAAVWIPVHPQATEPPHAELTKKNTVSSFFVTAVL
jgi:hypothetical protein